MLSSESGKKFQREVLLFLEILNFNYSNKVVCIEGTGNQLDTFSHFDKMPTCDG